MGGVHSKQCFHLSTTVNGCGKATYFFLRGDDLLLDTQQANLRHCQEVVKTSYRVGRRSAISPIPQATRMKGKGCLRLTYMLPKDSITQ